MPKQAKPALYFPSDAKIPGAGELGKCGAERSRGQQKGKAKNKDS
jgi:hypothetical protein